MNQYFTVLYPKPFSAGICEAHALLDTKSVLYTTNLHLSLITRKPVFGVFDQVRLKPACAATEASYRLEISDVETRDIILSRQ